MHLLIKKKDKTHAKYIKKYPYLCMQQKLKYKNLRSLYIKSTTYFIFCVFYHKIRICHSSIDA